MSNDRLSNLLSSEHYAPQDPTVESLVQSNRYLGALIQFVTSTLEMQSLEDIAWYLTESVIGQLGFEDCIVYFFDSDSQLLVQSAAFGEKNPKGKVILDRITLKLGEGIVGRCAATRQTVLINDLSGAEDYIVDDKCRQSELAVPIVYEGQLIGVIDSEHSDKDFYTSHHTETLKAVASVIASKYANLENVRKLEQTIHALEDVKFLQRALFDITELVHLSDDLDDFYDRLHDILSELIEADSFYICLFDEKSGESTFPYFYEHKLGQLKHQAIAPGALVQRLASKVLLEKSPQLLDEQEVIDFAHKSSSGAAQPMPFAWMGVPLVIDNQTRGVVAVQNIDRRESFSEKSQEILCYVAQKISIAIKRKSDETLLQQLALHDELTGLPNRALFIDRLTHALDRDVRLSERLTCIMFLDLDRFKLVNDTYGHHVGDQLLKSVSKKIRRCLRQEDTLARLGGDEFAILLEDVADLSVVEDLSARIIDALKSALIAGEHTLFTSTSIGIVHANEFPPGPLLPSDMLRCADNAMYQAKQQGKGCYVFHQQMADNYLQDVLLVEQDLVSAIRQNQFVCYLQPIVNLKTRFIAGFETLVRWEHPDKGLITPAHFIDVAEKSGQIVEIDRIMLVNACKLLKNCREKGIAVPYLNINVSSHSIASEDYFSYFQTTLKKYKIDHGQLNIEITERALINNLDKANFILSQVKDTGQQVILDDFGTGYSSLSYLHQLPIDVVKIDRSFVSTISQSGASKSITKAIISLADSLNMKVVVEGIEDASQRDIVVSLGAEYGQGFLFYAPMTAEEAIALLRAQQEEERVID